MNIEDRKKKHRQRLQQVMQLIAKAEASLNRSRERVFATQHIDEAWVNSIETMPEREDMLEAFVAKFNRFQDMLGDKLLPALLTWKEESSGAFIDNLNRAERLGWIESSYDWLEARALRNKLVYEYMVDAEVFVQSLKLADELSATLLACWKKMQSEVESIHAPK